ncbi:MAG: hypothetical protein ABJJ25_01865 [Eudoraea sp.]|uniref:hypothetical protein n=1 Tax=Eudoraea sp. TaxID=1979955 RepID=UPI003265145D
METVIMNWEAISAIGQIVGALTVFITLIYLAIQLKQNTAAVATSTYESTMTGFNDINVVVASHPELASLLDRGCQKPDTLTSTEIVQFNFILRCYANQWWKLYKLYKRGNLPLEEWKIFAQEASQFFEQPGCKPFRDQNSLFADLYLEFDKYKAGTISDFGFELKNQPNE